MVEFGTATGFVAIKRPTGKVKRPDSIEQGQTESPIEREFEVIYLKACPKCSGDVELAYTPDGRILQCLQCAFTVDSPEAARRAAAEKAKKTVAA